VFAASPCVVERTGSEAFTDAPPDLAAPDMAYANPLGSCRSGGVARALSADRENVKRAIRRLATGGASAPQVGMAWAWYLLSPEWSYLWPQSAAAGAYSDLNVRLANNRPKLRKVAVILQSSTPTVQHCQGVDDRLIACPSPNGSAVEQVRRICGGMHRAGIAIFAIALDLHEGNEMTSVLRDACARTKATYYDVHSGSELQQAFRDIALQISPLIEGN
jgi:hypothetical protein